MHCKPPRCRTTGQMTLPRCVRITSSGESASVWQQPSHWSNMLTSASVSIFSNLIEDSPWSGPAVESFASSSVCLQALQPRRLRLWALTAQEKSFSLVEICFLLSEVLISLSCNLPADQIFNILSQEPLQNCERDTQTLWILNPNHSYFFLSATPPSLPSSRWGLWRRCPHCPCAPDSSVWLSPCSSQNSTPTAGRFGPERPSEAERSDRLHAQTPNRCFKKGFVTTEPAEWTSGISVPLTSFDPGYIFDHLCVPSHRHHRLALHGPDPGRLVVWPC